VLSNELPRLADASGALASRFIVIVMTRSFYGREDLGLYSKLVAELPGILNWAIAGWQRLTSRGYFDPPASSAEAVQDLEDLSSPIGAFLREQCIIRPGRTVLVAHLFAKWQEWCAKQGRDHPGTVQSFGRDLRTTVPSIRVIQPRTDDARGRCYDGVGLR
jgi:putative DNA primase/helicase